MSPGPVFAKATYLDDLLPYADLADDLGGPFPFSTIALPVNAVIVKTESETGVRVL